MAASESDRGRGGTGTSRHGRQAGRQPGTRHATHQRTWPGRHVAREARLRSVILFSYFFFARAIFFLFFSRRWLIGTETE
ncbi:hypothetical protein GQ55_3G128000 [Panicum hallii var. hallii]|uniref:Uncharacterized protein n=1 Tax=Panicum hallii var. hallii TaxID=1504633 RepID=A0A2T7E8T8_9POAL|nr:hypothetical protein GQ55_3G128000 [Panicum hallii var. hallii]